MKFIKQLFGSCHNIENEARKLQNLARMLHIILTEYTPRKKMINCCLPLPPPTLPPLEISIFFKKFFFKRRGVTLQRAIPLFIWNSFINLNIASSIVFVIFMSTFELIDIRFIEKVQSNTVMVEQYCISTRILVFECVWLSSPHCSHTLAGCIYFFLTSLCFYFRVWRWHKIMGSSILWEWKHIFPLYKQKQEGICQLSHFLFL